MHKYLFTILLSSLVFCTGNINAAEGVDVPISSSQETYVDQESLNEEPVFSVKMASSALSLSIGTTATALLTIDNGQFGTASVISTSLTLLVTAAPWGIDFIRRKYKQVYQNH